MKDPLAKQFRRELKPAEKKLWRVIRREKLDGFRFRREQVVDLFIVDFYCESARLVVEVEDDEELPYRTAGDRLRDRVFKENGVQLLAFKEEDILTNLPWVIDRIRTCLRKGMKKRI